ncbi:riboflavin kinase [Naganishia albida]|nr:riboflavin kinase [Naganishia albida]
MTITSAAETLPTTTPAMAKQYEMAPVDRASRPMIVGPAAPEAPYPLKMVGRVTKGFGRGSKELGIPTANLPDDAVGGLTSLGWTGVYYGFARIYPDTKDGEPVSEEEHEDADLQRLSSSALAQLPQHTAAYPPSSTASSALPSRTGSPAPTLPTHAEGLQSLLPSRKHKKRRLQKEDYQVWPMVMSVGWNPYYKNEKLTAEVHIMHQFPTNFYGHTMAVMVLGYIRPELDYISKEALIADINTDVKVALNCLQREAYVAFANDEYFAGSEPRERTDAETAASK